MKSIKILGAVAFLGTCFLPLSAMAATDGTIGTTSTGTANISLTIPKLIRARSFADFSLGTYTGTGDLDGNDDLNISTNYGTGTRTYQVTPAGSGAAGAFTITDGSETIAYNAYFNDATGTAGRVALSNGTALTAQGNAAKPLSTATLNANLSVNVPEANIQAVGNGTYTGTITLVFAPE